MSVNFLGYLIAIVKSFMIFFSFLPFLSLFGQLSAHSAKENVEFSIACIKHAVSIMCSVWIFELLFFFPLVF